MTVKFRLIYKRTDGEPYTKTREIHLKQSQGIRDAWILATRLGSETDDELVSIERIQ